MAKTLNDIISLMNLYLGDFSPDTTDELNKKIQAINTAKDIILSKIGLPSSERTYIIKFVEDLEKYILPSDFLEPISLEYDSLSFSNGNLNSEFIYLYPEEINKQEKYYNIVFWGIDYADGLKKIYIKTRNSVPIRIISNCDSLDNWSTSNDATNLTIDNIRYLTNNASLKFKIDETLSGISRATLIYNSPTSFDFSLYKDIGNFLFYLYIENATGLSSVTLKWGTNNTNYWYLSKTSPYDRDTFTSLDWNKLVFEWENAYVIGNPNPSNVSFFQIDIDYNESQFISPQYWNIDRFIFFVFDKLILRYYSENVVKSSGGVLKKDFENTNDIALFADSDASLINLVAQLASYIYNPLVNKEQSSLPIIKDIFTYSLQDYSLRFPKRTPIFYRGSINNPKLRWK